MFEVFDDDRLSPRRGEMFVARVDERRSPEGEMWRRPAELLARTFDPSGSVRFAVVFYKRNMKGAPLW
jgi:hypothetical protein